MMPEHCYCSCNVFKSLRRVFWVMPPRLMSDQGNNSMRTHEQLMESPPCFLPASQPSRPDKYSQQWIYNPCTRRPTAYAPNRSALVVYRHGQRPFLHAPAVGTVPDVHGDWPNNAFTSTSEFHLILSNLGLNTHITPSRTGSTPKRGPKIKFMRLHSPGQCEIAFGKYLGAKAAVQDFWGLTPFQA